MGYPLMALRTVQGSAAIVRVTGEDAAAFLQGQCSVDLRSAALADALWLNRKGRVLAHTRIAKDVDGSFILIGPHLAAPELIAIITANVIADDVTATDEASRWHYAVAWGTEAPVIAGGHVFATARMGVPAWDVLVPATAAMPGVRAEVEELTRARLQAGIPAVPTDCGANEFPQECGLDAWVSYTKGCYLGQEVMARIQSMGSLRRILRRVEGPVSPGLELRTVEGKAAGLVRSALDGLGLALVSVDLAEGAVLASAAGDVRLGAPACMPLCS